MYLKDSADVKISTFLEKNGGWGCGSRNGPLTRKVPFCNPNMLFLLHTSVDTDKVSLKVRFVILTCYFYYLDQ